MFIVTLLEACLTFVRRRCFRALYGAGVGRFRRRPRAPAPDTGSADNAPAGVAGHHLEYYREEINRLPQTTKFSKHSLKTIDLCILRII